MKSKVKTDWASRSAERLMDKMYEHVTNRQWEEAELILAAYLRGLRRRAKSERPEEYRLLPGSDRT